VYVSNITDKAARALCSPHSTWLVTSRLVYWQSIFDVALENKRLVLGRERRSLGSDFPLKVLFLKSPGVSHSP